MTNITPNTAQSPLMKVRKRDGSLEPVDVIQITKKVARYGAGLEHINPYLVASRAISGIYDGVTTKELDMLLMQTASMLMTVHKKIG